MASPDESESIRLAQQMQQEEMAANFAQPAFSAAELEAMDAETRESIQLALRLQEEERNRMEEQAAAAERLDGEPEDEDSIALAIRLQQEDDEAALRDALGVQDGEEDPGSPSQYSYEQLMRLQDTVGVVSRGASNEEIGALRTLTVAQVRAPGSKIVLGDQCSICRMEFEDEDVLRCMPCNHAEHADCLDQWLAINKSCPLCQNEVKMPAECPPDESVVPSPPIMGCAHCTPMAATPDVMSVPLEPPPIVAPLADGTNNGMFGSRSATPTTCT